MNTVSIHELHTESFEVKGSELVKIPEGDYPVRYLGYATANMFNQGKLILSFVIESGDYAGITLERFYPVKLRGKIGRKGGFSVTMRSQFLREFVTVTGWDTSKGRLDRIPMTRLRGKAIKARVRTVDRDYERDSIPDCLQYSKIKKLLST